MTLPAEKIATQIEAGEIARTLVKKHQAGGIWLFGSVARRRPLRPDSDIDLAVEGMPPKTFYQLAGDLQSASGRQVDLVRLESVQPKDNHSIG